MATGRAERPCLFSLGKDEYERILVPVLRPTFTPRTLVQLHVVLPYSAPLPDGFAFTWIHDDHSCTFRFTSVTGSAMIASGPLPPQVTSSPRTHTSVEMTLSSAFHLDSNDDIVSDCYDQLLSSLNQFLLGYMVSMRDPDVYRITRDMLPTGTPFRYVRLDPWREEQFSVLVTSRNVPYRKEPLAQDDWERVASFSRVTTFDLNPFVGCEEAFLTARRYLSTGFLREAVLFGQTSVEILLMSLFREFLSSEGESTEAVDRALETASLVALVRREMHPRLGGTWRLDDKRRPIGMWYCDCYSTRNRVIHAGYMPTYSEASAALAAAQELRNYVVRLLRAKRQAYPEIWRYFDPSITVDFREELRRRREPTDGL